MSHYTRIPCSICGRLISKNTYNTHYKVCKKKQEAKNKPYIAERMLTAPKQRVDIDINKLKRLYKRVKTEHPILSDLLSEFSDEDDIAIGESSAYLFIGNKIQLYNDLPVIDEYLGYRYLDSEEYVKLLNRTVIDVRAKTISEPSDIYILILEGDDVGYCWFLNEYLPWIRTIKRRVEENRRPLTEDIVRQIKQINRETGQGSRPLSKKFNIPKSTIDCILRGQTYKDVP